MTNDLLLELQEQGVFSDFAASHPQPDLQNSQDQDDTLNSPLAPLNAMVSAASWSTSPQDPSDRYTSTTPDTSEFQQCAFSDLLQQCSKLQQHLLLAENPPAQTSQGCTTLPPSQRRAQMVEMSGLQTQKMLEDVEAGCKLILEICEKCSALDSSTSEQRASPPETAPCSVLDPASVSLITAVIFKALQVCNLLLSGAGPRTRTLADVLLYKRLDINLTLVRVAMSEVEGLGLDKQLLWQQLSNKATWIEKRFAG